MSRTKIFLMLFLAVLIGSAGAVFLFQNWITTYHQQVTQPALSRDLRAARQTTQLLALQKLQVVSQQAHTTELTKAVGEQNKTNTQEVLNGLKDKAKATFAAVVDNDGKLLAAQGLKGMEAGAEWPNKDLLESTKKGKADKAFADMNGKSYILVAAPLVGIAKAPAKTKEGGDDDKDDAKDEDKPAPKRKAPAKSKAKKEKVNEAKNIKK